MFCSVNTLSYSLEMGSLPNPELGQHRESPSSPPACCSDLVLLVCTATQGFCCGAWDMNSDCPPSHLLTPKHLPLNCRRENPCQ